MLDVRLLASKAFRVLRRYGPVETLRIAWSYLRYTRTADAFDLKYGTDTAGVVPLWRFRIDSSNARFGQRYETSDAGELELAITCIRQDSRTLAFTTQAFTFIDIGCGKGKVLLAARELGFSKLIGVEFVHELAHIAKANLATVGAINAVVINTDASDFAFPEQDSIVYLFNPFSQEVMRKMVHNLRIASPARRFIIYNNPICAEVLDSSGFLKRVASVPGTRFRTVVWSVLS
jgi:SAM-dependent methyltransferase